MAFSSNTLGPGWRCDACDYCLEGLPDRGESTQCPECGHVGRSFASPPPPLSPVTIAGFGAAAPISALSIAFAATFLSRIQGSISVGYGERTAIELSIAVALIYLGIAVWLVPRRRYPLIRWFGVLADAAVVAWCIGDFMAPWHGSFVTLPLLVHGILAAALLASPEAALLRKRLRRKARP